MFSLGVALEDWDRQSLGFVASYVEWKVICKVLCSSLHGVKGIRVCVCLHDYRRMQPDAEAYWILKTAVSPCYSVQIPEIRICCSQPIRPHVASQRSRIPFVLFEAVVRVTVLLLLT